MRANLNYRLVLCLMTALGISLFALGQDEKTVTEAGIDGIAWGMGLLLLFIFFGLVYLVTKIRSLGKEDVPVTSFRQWWRAMDARIFTKAIPIEKEADHLLDHDYDGIKELDNSLPPWWKYGFYITVVLAVVYMLHFHVWNTGLTPEQEYDTEIALAAKQVEEYRKRAGEMVDEKTVTLAYAKGIEEGRKLFQTSCIACHGAKGEGGVGPNLTDSYWLHGGSLNDVFKTVKYGVPDKGMQAWEKSLSPSQIKNISSYIKSIAGTNPPNSKAPQGEPFEEKSVKQAAKDSTAIAKR